MLIIDDIRYPDGTEYNDVVGGAGTYAALGCRLFLPKLSDSTVITHVIHHGEDDFPTSVVKEIRDWETHALFDKATNGYTNRGLNTYDDNGVRHFKHVHKPPNRVEVPDLQGKFGSQLTNGDIYHMICSPYRCVALCDMLKRCDCRSWKEIGSSQIIIWEPNEGDCTPNNRESFQQALNYVDVFSPNLEELCSLYRRKIDLEDGEVGYQQLDSVCRDLLKSTNNASVALVIRLGDKGCYIQPPLHEKAGSPHHFAASEGREASHATRIPAYKIKDVVDVTGAGNAFLGGFAYGMYRVPLSSKITQLETAAICGTVAASFAIEQVGMPKLKHEVLNGTGYTETWNDARPLDRYMEHATNYLNIRENEYREEESQ